MHPPSADILFPEQRTRSEPGAQLDMVHEPKHPAIQILAISNQEKEEKTTS